MPPHPQPESSSTMLARTTVLLVALGTFSAPARAPRPAPARRLLSGLVWRNLGPFRAGRVSAVSGVIGQPGTFYIGLPLGGVWKTTSAGETWTPIFDAVTAASSVGALEVAPSDPNIIYVGMGDLITGGGINEGDGVYAIAMNSNAQRMLLIGNFGLYRSADGGTTWRQMDAADRRIANGQGGYNCGA